MQLWRFDDVRWGDTLCAAPRCCQVAETLWEGTPYCVGCADLVVDRELSMDLLPKERAYELPPLFEDPAPRPKPRRRRPDPEWEMRSPAIWLLEQGGEEVFPF